MASIAPETLYEAHRLAGFLTGLEDSLRHWRAGAVTDGEIERLRHALAEAQGKADYVANALSKAVAAELGADLRARIDSYHQMARGAA